MISCQEQTIHFHINGISITTPTKQNQFFQHWNQATSCPSPKWLPIQNYLKLHITEKRRNYVKYLTWNSVRLKFVKKTSMSNSVESLGYIKCYSSSSPRLFKSPSNSIIYNCQKICSWSRIPKTIMEIKKRPQFSRTVVFNCRPFPNILKYKDHWWDLQMICWTRLYSY